MDAPDVGVVDFHLGDVSVEKPAYDRLVAVACGVLFDLDLLVVLLRLLLPLDVLLDEFRPVDVALQPFPQFGPPGFVLS